MAFKVVPAAQSEGPEHAVLMGIAFGLSEFYSLPEHPCAVDEWLNSQSAEPASGGEQAAHHDRPSHDAIDRG